MPDQGKNIDRINTENMHCYTYEEQHVTYYQLHLRNANCKIVVKLSYIAESSWEVH